MGRVRDSVRGVNAAFEELRTRLAEITDLAQTGAILHWDQQTMMPPRGATVRAEQLATLGRIGHDRFTDPQIGRLLDQLAGFEEQHDFDSFEASLIRVTRRDWLKACKVPSELRAEMSRASTLGAYWIQSVFGLLPERILRKRPTPKSLKPKPAGLGV